MRVDVSFGTIPRKPRTADGIRLFPGGRRMLREASAELFDTAQMRQAPRQSRERRLSPAPLGCYEEKPNLVVRVDVEALRGR